MDAELRSARARVSFAPSTEGPSSTEVQDSLDQAIIVGEQTPEEDPFSDDSPKVEKRLLWFLGKRTQA
jgi:hypothetical protein